MPHKEYLVNQNIMIKLLSKKGILYDFKADLKRIQKLFKINEILLFCTSKIFFKKT